MMVLVQEQNVKIDVFVKKLDEILNLLRTIINLRSFFSFTLYMFCRCKLSKHWCFITINKIKNYFKSLNHALWNRKHAMASQKHVRSRQHLFGRTEEISSQSKRNYKSLPKTCLINPTRLVRWHTNGISCQT